MLARFSRRMAVIGLAAATVIGAGAAEAQQRESVIDKIQREGVLRVCVAIATPWMMKDPASDEFIGFDVDMIKELASIMEVRYELVAVPAFGQLIASLQAGRCDVIMTALTRTTRRAMAVAFTEPYFVLGTGWVVSKDRDDLNTLADLNQPSVRIAVEQGALSEAQTRKHMPNSTVRSLPGGGDALRLAEVQSGRADAAAVDSIKVPIYASQFDWAKFIPEDVFDNPVDPSGIAYAARREDLDLINFLNVFIYNLEANGTIPALKAKWVQPEHIRID
jgi:ABC-type amino acid transport substrate-binding protein